MAKMSQEVMAMFNDREASKVLATVDKDDNLNVAPIGSLAAVSEETIAFAYIFPGKTKENLEATRKAAVMAFKAMSGYQVKGNFEGFQSSGPLFDKFAAQIKQLLKMDIKSVGTIKVAEVYSVSPAEAGKKLA
jgi:hypothetical protein